MVRAALVAAHVLSVLEVVRIYCRTEFRLCQTVVFVRHAQVPQDIFITHLRNQSTARKLTAVIVGPDRDQLKLTGLAVEVHLEVMVIVNPKAGKFRTLLKAHVLHQTTDLIVVRVEVQLLVLEVVYLERIAVGSTHLCTAHAAHMAHPARIDSAEGGLLIVVDDAVISDQVIYIHIMKAAGKMKPAPSVALGVDVAAAPDRIETGVELGVVRLVTFKARQAVPVAQSHRLTPFAAAQVQRVTVNPPFRAALIGKLTQGLVAVSALIAHHHVLLALCHACFPSRGAHAPVHALHYQPQVLRRTGGQ